jgi:putative acyl-CoA dehydrogenase
MDLLSTDLALAEGVCLEGAQWHLPALQQLGKNLGSTAVQKLAEQANRHTPELHTHDRFGNRIDVVEFHPAWHALLALLRQSGMHSLPWEQPVAGAHVAGAAGFFLHAQVEVGSLCPVTMTFAAVPVLQQEPALFAKLKDPLYSHSHDARDLPISAKSSILLGMGLTEKQGGSDLRSKVEFHDAFGIMIGPEGHGIQTLLDMANTTRLDCIIASSALMRQGLVEAVHHARHRIAFGRLLAEQLLPMPLSAADSMLHQEKPLGVWAH